MSSPPRIRQVVRIGAVLVVWAVSMAGCSTSGADTKDVPKVPALTSAKLDASTLGRDIRMWYVDSDGVPFVSLEDGVFTVGDPDEVYEYHSTWNANLNDAVLTTDIVSWDDWCVTVSNTTGTAAASYSSARGLEEGAACGNP